MFELRAFYLSSVSQANTPGRFLSRGEEGIRFCNLEFQRHPSLRGFFFFFNTKCERERERERTQKHVCSHLPRVSAWETRASAPQRPEKYKNTKSVSNPPQSGILSPGDCRESASPPPQEAQIHPVVMITRKGNLGPPSSIFRMQLRIIFTFFSHHRNNK